MISRQSKKKNFSPGAEFQRSTRFKSKLKIHISCATRVLPSSSSSFSSYPYFSLVHSTQNNRYDQQDDFDRSIQYNTYI